MKSIKKVLLFTTVALMLCLAPMTAWGAPVDVTGNPVGTIQSDIQDEIDAVAGSGGGTVTVIGNKNDADATLTLNIPADVDVEWRATYSNNGDIIGGLVSLSGAGSFEVTGAGRLHKQGGGHTIMVNELNTNANGSITVTVSGNGRVESVTGSAIRLRGEGDRVIVEGDGVVFNMAGDPNNSAINFNLHNTNPTISPNVIVRDNGSVSSRNTTTGSSTSNGYAIQTNGDVEIYDNAQVYAWGPRGRAINALSPANVTVADYALVYSHDGIAICGRGTIDIWNYAHVYNISSDYPVIGVGTNDSAGTKVDVNVNGGHVEAKSNGGHAISTPGIVTINDGEVSATTGNAINLTTSGGNSGRAIVNGGLVTTATGNAINTTSSSNPTPPLNPITVNGGWVRATGAGNAISPTSSDRVVVTGGWVSATTGYAITGTSASITVSGGFVFAYSNSAGNFISGNQNVIQHPGFTGPTGNGIVASWQELLSGGRTPSHTYYVGPESTLHLTVRTASPAPYDNPQTNVDVHWTNGGINYFNDLNNPGGGTPNEGFFPLPVRVISSFGLVYNLYNGKFYLHEPQDKKLVGEYNGHIGNYDNNSATTPDDLKLKGFGFTWNASYADEPIALIIADFDATLYTFGDPFILGDPALGFQTGNTLTITLEGINSFEASGFPYVPATPGSPAVPEHKTVNATGILVYGVDLTIKGDGALLATGKADEVISGMVDTGIGVGIEIDGGSLTVDSGKVEAIGSGPGAGYGMLTQGTSLITIEGGAVTAQGDTQAFNAAPSIDAGLAYVYWQSPQASHPGGSGTLVVPPHGPGNMYVYNAGHKYVRIVETPCAVVYNVTIGGTESTELPVLPVQTATVKLYDITVNLSGFSDINAASWFTNLPAGVTVTASAGPGADIITFTFSGTPLTTSNARFNITIPTIRLNGSNNPLPVLYNPLAGFRIVGYVSDQSTNNPTNPECPGGGGGGGCDSAGVGITGALVLSLLGLWIKRKRAA